jgi:hypothetical protein
MCRPRVASSRIDQNARHRPSRPPPSLRDASPDATNRRGHSPSAASSGPSGFMRVNPRGGAAIKLCTHPAFTSASQSPCNSASISVGSNTMRSTSSRTNCVCRWPSRWMRLVMFGTPMPGGARGFLVGDRRAAADLAAQKAFQDVKDLRFSRRSLFLLKALSGAPQKQQRPLRIIECFRGEPVFALETEASLRILPIQPDQLGASASFFRGCPSGFDRNEDFPTPPLIPPLSSKIKQNAPEILKVCRSDCFVISGAWNAIVRRVR